MNASLEIIIKLRKPVEEDDERITLEAVEKEETSIASTGDRKLARGDAKYFI